MAMAESIDSENSLGEDVMDDLAPGTELLHGQYKIVDFLNAGGFGITYRAVDSLDRKVVIKECFPGAFCRRSRAIVQPRSRSHRSEFDSIVRLFVQEARSLSKLQHPGIVGVHQVFEENDTAYMALDFVEGRDLLEIMEDPDTDLPPDRIVDILRQMLDAIGFVHSKDMLHRDISPDNILVDETGRPVLIDFGAARQQAQKQSRVLSAMRVVKDGYSPQEFYITGSEQGPYSDLYALGASFYHLIAGETPPDSQRRLTAIAQGEADPYMPLQGRFPDYDDAVLASIDHALKVLPKERMQSAAQWLAMMDGKEIPQAPAAPAADPVATPQAAAPKRGKAGLGIGVAALAMAAVAGFVVTQTDLLSGGAPAPLDGALNQPVETAAGSDAPAPQVPAPAPQVSAPIPTDTAPTDTAQADPAPAEADPAPDAQAGIIDPVPTVPAPVETTPDAQASTADPVDVVPAIRPVPRPTRGASTPDAPFIVALEEPFPNGAPVFDVAPEPLDTPAAPTDLAGAPALSDTPAIATPADGAAQAAVPAGLQVTTPGWSDLEDLSAEMPGTELISSLRLAGGWTVALPTTGDLSIDASGRNQIVTLNGTPVADRAAFDAQLRAGADLSAIDEVSIELGIGQPGQPPSLTQTATLAVVHDVDAGNAVTFRTQRDGEGWATRVFAVGDSAETDLVAGDTVMALVDTGEPIEGGLGMRDLLERELTAGRTQFSFVVQRDGANWVASMTIPVNE